MEFVLRQVHSGNTNLMFSHICSQWPLHYHHYCVEMPSCDKTKRMLLQPVTLKPNAPIPPPRPPPPPPPLHTVTQELRFKQNQTLTLPHARPPVHLVNRKPLFIFSTFQTLSSSSANPPTDPLASPVTSAARIYDFLQKVAARSEEGKTDPKTHRQRR